MYCIWIFRNKLDLNQETSFYNKWYSAFKARLLYPYSENSVQYYSKGFWFDRSGPISIFWATSDWALISSKEILKCSKIFFFSMEVRLELAEDNSSSP
jgi:hypothetical protein